MMEANVRSGIVHSVEVHARIEREAFRVFTRSISGGSIHVVVLYPDVLTRKIPTPSYRFDYLQVAQQPVRDIECS